MSSSEVLVRSTWHAATVQGAKAPYDAAHLKIFYPATSDGTDVEAQSGEMAADLSGGPRPVVVFLNGVNVAQDAYRWLAVELVRAGFTAVTYDHVGQLGPHFVGMSPGFDFTATAPGVYGTRPVGTALQPVLDAVAELNAAGPLAGMFDLDRIAFGGHSAGGTVALQSARRAYFSGLRAVFAYAGHTVASSTFGLYPPGTVLECASDVDALLMSGDEDGVFRASAAKYGDDGDDPVAACFDRGIPPRDEPTTTGDWLVQFKGANHFAIGTNEDPTASRGFQDGIASVPPEATRETLMAVVTNFLRSALSSDEDARQELADLEASPPPTISLIRHR